MDECEFENYYSEEFGEDYLNNNDLYRASSTVVMKSEEILNERENTIKEAMEYLSITRDEAILSLMHYQWNLENLKDKWFEDVEENRSKCGIIPANGVNAQKNKECLVCYAEEDPDFFSLNCSHFFCKDCWENYLISLSQDMYTMIGAKCMQKGCNVAIPESVFLKLLPKEHIRTYQKVISTNFTDYNRDIKWCPKADCGRCIKSSNHKLEIKCDCGFSFCFKCSKESHRPCLCDMVEKWEIRSKSESENVKWLVANTKKCPQCKKFIEKNAGCNHMICSKAGGGCGYEFCWICLGPSIHDGGQHNWNCNRFDPEKAKKDQNEAQNAKQDLERFVFYCDRSINHLKGMEWAIKLKQKIVDDTNRLCYTCNLPFEEVAFLNDAVETIYEGRKMLKYSYIFGFYLKINDKEKPLFEHSQFLLEQNVDKMNFILEKGEVESLIQEENLEMFRVKLKNLKEKLVNLLTVTNKYKENLLDDIDYKMSDSIDYEKLN